MDGQSYTALTKTELCRIKPGRNDALLAECAAFAFCAGSLRLMHGGAALELSSETRDVTVRIASILARLYGGEPEILSTERTQPKKHTVFALDISPNSVQGKFLFDIGFLSGTRDDFSFGEINEGLFEGEVGSGAALRGAFLACGVLVNPEKGYCLELAVSNTAFAEMLFDKIKGLGIEARLSERREKNLIYIKRMESISQALILMGASSVMLELENIRIFKDVKNNINRSDNCIIGNLGKTIDASGRQIDDIKFLLDYGYRLSPSLEEACHLRLDNPDATLNELAQIGNTTKSALNKRFIKLRKIREQLENI